MIWITKSGKKIDTKDMTSNHLHNTINLLYRRGKIHALEMFAAMSYSGNGEAACHAADNAADEAGENMIYCDQIISVMKTELQSRS